jgi:hypothetical protein
MAKFIGIVALGVIALIILVVGWKTEDKHWGGGW